MASEVDNPGGVAGFELGSTDAADVSATEFGPEKGMANPHDEQNPLLSITSLEHDGQRAKSSLELEWQILQQDDQRTAQEKLGVDLIPG